MEPLHRLDSIMTAEVGPYELLGPHSVEPTSAAKMPDGA